MSGPVAMDLATQTGRALLFAAVDPAEIARITGWNAAVAERLAADPEHAEHVAKALTRRRG